ncbi:TPA: hypothetical protein UL576_004046 [Klebsiella pneumoniae]|uniref:hypothetical protein n=1 Tax=Klebsiella/Raoultella group TaxID=2890311 RepID=UPI000BFC7331|nr:hypothetical protein [Klebsiella oxytoca]EIX9725592.1 hypothetical protein [Klebsiella pneumoniae]ELO5146915.1 hypothetical protein [Citrobacter freundii]ELQ7945313.1 hypothetical protein [Citrobacter freundii]ELQ7995440.1 hypothetical protein [Citrobacter freundii]EMB5616914.1 hypothetical protein [Klebsiella pneumoniae]
MNHHPVELVYKALTSILAPYLTDAKPVTGSCSCCGRPASEFGFKGFEQKNSYGQMVMHCIPCQSFFTSAPDVMGVENPKKPTTGQKFGMWSGVGAIIEINTLRAVLFAPPGVVAKLPPAFFEKVNVVTATTGQHLQYLFNTNIEYPAIYVQDFGRKTYELVRSLRASYSDNAIYACCDQLMTPQNSVSFVIDLNKAKRLHEQMATYGKKEVDIFIRTVSMLAYARITPEKASDEFTKHGLVPLLRALPADPHQRLTLLRLLRKV